MNWCIVVYHFDFNLYFSNNFLHVLIWYFCVFFWWSICSNILPFKNGLFFPLLNFQGSLYILGNKQEETVPVWRLRSKEGWIRKVYLCAAINFVSFIHSVNIHWTSTLLLCTRHSSEGWNNKVSKYSQPWWNFSPHVVVIERKGF